MSTFAQRLKEAMKQAGLNQTELSEKVGTSKASISQYLSGKYTPKKEHMKALAEATGAELSYLMGFDASAGKQAIPARKITVYDAAKCMGKSQQFIRIGLQRERLPFGTAVPGTGEKWSYDIRPEKFREYVGAKQFDAYFGLNDDERR